MNGKFSSILVVFVLIGAALFMFGCTLPNAPVCGNGVCEIGENSLSLPTYCSADCGAQITARDAIAQGLLSVQTGGIFQTQEFLVSSGLAISSNQFSGEGFDPHSILFDKGNFSQMNSSLGSNNESSFIEYIGSETVKSSAKVYCEATGEKLEATLKISQISTDISPTALCGKLDYQPCCMVIMESSVSTPPILSVLVSDSSTKAALGNALVDVTPVVYVVTSQIPRDGNTSTGQSGITDASGLVVFKGLGAGEEYVVNVSAQGFASPTSQKVVLVDGSTYQLNFALDPNPQIGTLKANVSDAVKVCIKAPCGVISDVSLQISEDTNGVATLVTNGVADSNGNYSVDLPAGKIYVALVSAPGYVSATYNGIKIYDGQATAVVMNLNRQKGPANLNVFVYDANTGVPLTYASSRAFVSMLSSSGGTNSLYTNPQGLAEFNGSLAGKYVVSASAQGYAIPPTQTIIINENTTSQMLFKLVKMSVKK